jgi:hypothetical protein
MHCYVYASLRKADTYLWLLEPAETARLPESLSLLLGDLRPVLEVELHPERKLPHEDTAQVLENLRNQGWHLQLPPSETLAVANHPAYRSALQDSSEDEE